MKKSGTLTRVITGISLLGCGFSPVFAVLLAFAVPLGFGQGAIDTGMNFYVSKHYSSRDMSWLHCCWGVGATLGPLIASVFLQSTGSWRSAYFAIGAAQVLAVGTNFSPLHLHMNGIRVCGLCT